LPYNLQRENYFCLMTLWLIFLGTELFQEQSVKNKLLHYYRKVKLVKLRHSVLGKSAPVPICFFILCVLCLWGFLTFQVDLRTPPAHFSHRNPRKRHNTDVEPGLPDGFFSNQKSQFG
jgi:hypothetical protein